MNKKNIGIFACLIILNNPMGLGWRTIDYFLNFPLNNVIEHSENQPPQSNEGGSRFSPQN